MKLQKEEKSEENNMKLSQKILYCRKKSGYSQEALAQLLGISRQAVSKWETGESEPEAGKLKLLADTFNVSIDWLLSSEEPIEIEEVSTNDTSQNTGQNLISGIGKVIRRYGWLVGLVIIFQGCVLTLMGLVARHNALSIIPDGLFTDNMMPTFNPMLSMAMLFIVLGIAMIVIGLILAIYLKRRFSNR